LKRKMTNFKESQLVWAKVKGYPWWPAIVLKVVSGGSMNNSGSVLVNFIGDNSHATVHEHKVADFNESFTQFCNGKNKKLQEAIKAARRIEKGESTFEDESCEFQQKEKSKVPVRRDQRSAEKETPKEKNSRENSLESETAKDSSTVDERQENVENNNLHAFENLLDFVPFRVTRAQCKNQHVEVRTEPLIYQSKKRVNRKVFKLIKKNNDSVLPSSDEKCTRKASLETPQAKQRDCTETDTDCTHQEKLSNNTSPIDRFNLHKSEEPAKVAIPRSNSSRKLFVTQIATTSENAIDPQSIFTPEKSIESDEKVKGELDYSHKKSQVDKTPEVQVVEHTFEQLLEALLEKFRNGQKVRKTDQNIIKLFTSLHNFESSSLNGYEIARSEVAKLLKTIKLLFSKYKHLALEIADKVLALITKLMKNIKEKVLEFCMDNTKYIRALNLPENNDQPKPEHNRFDKSKIIIEAPSSLTIRIEEEMTPNSQRLCYFNGLSQNMKSLYSPCIEPEGRVAFRKDSTDFYAQRMENANQHADNFLLRKKICQRFTKLLHDIYKLEKEKSQEITLKIEGKIHGCHGNVIENYKHNVQNFYNLLKQQHLTLDEIFLIKTMDTSEFNEFLNKRLYKVFENGDSLLRDRAYSYAFSISTEALESPSNQSFAFDLNPVDRFSHEHIRNDHHHSPTFNHFRIPPKHNLTPKENHHHNHTGLIN